jgi:hypothetical protein
MDGARNLRRFSARMVWLAMALGIPFGPVEAAPPAQCAIATIEVEPGAGGITLTGRAVGLASCQLTASMAVERSGRSGQVKTRQAGKFVIEKGQATKVATLAVSMTAQDSLTVELKLTSAGHQIATSSLHVGR